MEVNPLDLIAVKPARTSYLDHAATTPMVPAAIAAYAEQLAVVGNPSSLHAAGRRARSVVEAAREELASIYGCRPSEIIVTSGGTEADNLAVKGIFRARRAQDGRRSRIVISAVEHHAILDPAHALAQDDGAQVVALPVDERGLVDPLALEAELREHASDTALVSVMWANNEVGTIQPIAELAQIAHRYGIPMHTDAVQAAGHLAVNFQDSGVDALTVTAHKIGGPVGVGALIARRDLEMYPVLHGGGQERQVRSGTIDAAAIHSWRVAAVQVASELPARVERERELRDQLLARIVEAVPDAQVRGVDPQGPDAHMRLSSIAHVTFPGCEGDSLIYLLDSHGVQASTGSACQAGIPQPSHVLLAMGLDELTARGALRFSLGATSTQEDIDHVIEVLPTVVERARRAGLATTGR
ncbi:aminotransferase class V [Jonesia denitrificans DSM 20603]|uniref:cysteine desulfurase n=1 Tax=Jonesia denitrificans (strain ATCC 14870 / DSM 20603 / BCRC 15368 / CIP 55.134 / JCM 11481 / NBRC 15587 / NCTC 10816 / Prevot 55134) TaxID=471856 RepID=C7QYX9_JONDD|nr:aminotransferase class V [Jonesia denitrificans DSM 20603]SQH21651.1 Cysteine desulfurase [Jonesia denitrificans]